jgi:hypothetical protein
VKEERYQPLAPHKPWKPERDNFNYQGCGDQTVLYHDVKTIGDSDLDLVEYFQEIEEELPQPDLNYNQITLQDIVNAAPSDAKLSDIRLNIQHYDILYVEVKFLYSKRDLEKEEAAYQAALEKYKKEQAPYLLQYKKYEENLAAFQEWKKEKEIKELEEKLAQLKSSGP